MSNSDNENMLEALTRNRNVNACLGTDDGNQKPKRPLSAYNFFLKEERKLLKNNSTDSKSNSGEVKSSRRPMKKRRLVDPSNDSLSALSTEKGKGADGDDASSGDISFERIGKLIGERWQEVKAKPELFVKYEKLADDDHKRYAKEMKSYNDRKKNILLSAVKSSENNASRTTAFEASPRLPSVEHRRASSDDSDSDGIAQVSRGSSSQPTSDEQSDQDDKNGHDLQQISHSDLAHHLNAAAASGQVPLINLQALFAANLSQQQANTSIPLEYLAAAASNQVPVTNAAVLAHYGAQLPYVYNPIGQPQHAITAVAPENSPLSAVGGRQQEEMNALRQETLYRELLQMEQAKAYLSNVQGLQGLPIQYQHVASPYVVAPSNLEALLAQQSGLQLAALQQSPQQVQLLSLLSSQLQNPAALQRYVNVIKFVNLNILKMKLINTETIVIMFLHQYQNRTILVPAMNPKMMQLQF